MPNANWGDLALAAIAIMLFIAMLSDDITF
jgi:hypothetical protein